jgi:hypothetical protein
LADSACFVFAFDFAFDFASEALEFVELEHFLFVEQDLSAGLGIVVVEIEAVAELELGHDF